MTTNAADWETSFLRKSRLRLIGSAAIDRCSETYAGEHDVRRCLLDRFAYLIVFACLTDETLVVAVAHARRKPLYWLKRLGK